ncbi:S1/P1 nuclease [Pseudoalteromonas sp. SSDWG2]|uniref:S1/P1 nuclease n=1 Tax=Pseudoalteromonas sp. SSDWG2 TaxID=3139391 RepID=UPI003BA93C31
MDLQHIRANISAFFFAVLLVVACLINQAWAWGANGHRIVAAIAEQNLSPQAKARLYEILGTQSLARVSTWADEMRSNPEYFWQKQSSRWHYINIDSQSEFSRSKFHVHTNKNDINNAHSAILSAISALSAPDTSIEDQRFYLKFLIHLIGDIHQPMHVGRSQDRGGNTIKVEFFNNPTNLHRLWDSQLLEQAQLSYSEYAQFLCCDNLENTQYKNKDSVQQWLLQSHKLASSIYSSTSEQIGYAYVDKYQRIMEQQLALGGHRLAELLNYIYQGTAGTPLQE